jgi:copper chaperone CopZ
MMNMKDFFYGYAEPVWILNHNEGDEENESGSNDTSEQDEFSPLTRDGSDLTIENEVEDEGNLTYEPVSILNHNEEDEESELGSSDTSEQDEFTRDGSYPAIENEVEDDGNLTFASRLYNYHYYSGDHYATHEEEKEVVLKVPICCGSCADSVKVALQGLEGVENVKCDIYNTRVTVITTCAPEDVLITCRTAFLKSQFWTYED